MKYIHSPQINAMNHNRSIHLGIYDTKATTTSMYNMPSISNTNPHYYHNTPMHYTVNLNGCKSDNFLVENFRFFLLIFAQNINCGYTLEPPQRVPPIYVLEQKYENNVNPSQPQFCYIKVGCKGVYITRTC